MKNVLIYSIGKKLCFQSNEIINAGRLEIFNEVGQKIVESTVSDTEYGSLHLEAPRGIYRVKLILEDSLIEKRIFIGE